jgi:hypothetical protein
MTNEQDNGDGSISEPIQTYLSPLEVSQISGLSRRRIYDWLGWGWLRGIRNSGRWHVCQHDWELFTSNCRGLHGRLMPSLYDWENFWDSNPNREEAA